MTERRTSSVAATRNRVSSIVVGVLSTDDSPVTHWDKSYTLLPLQRSNGCQRHTRMLVLDIQHGTFNEKQSFAVSGLYCWDRTNYLLASILVKIFEPTDVIVKNTLADSNLLDVALYLLAPTELAAEHKSVSCIDV